MVASASGIRAGAAYVEITADDTPMMRRLAASQARLRHWVAENSAPALTRGTEASALGEGGKGFLGGGFRGTELFDTGLKLATAIAAAKVAIKDVQIFAAVFRGDMEGARKAAEELPFGLGAIVKELSGPVDAAMKAFVFRLRGIYDDPGPGKVDKRARAASVEQYNRGVTAIHAAQKALDKATMSAREYAQAEVAGMNLAASEAQRLLALKLRLIEVEEQKAAWAKANARREMGEGLIVDAMNQWAKATMSEREFIEYEVRGMGLAAEQAQSLLNWRLAILDATERQKQADEEWADVLRSADDEVQAWNRSIEEGVAAEGRQREKAWALGDSLRTPEEQACDQIGEYREMLEGGYIGEDTYQRAVRKAVEDAAAALPDVARATVGVRGTFNALEVAGMGAGGVSDRIARATEETAKNTEKIAQLAASLGVTFN